MSLKIDLTDTYLISVSDPDKNDNMTITFWVTPDGPLCAWADKINLSDMPKQAELVISSTVASLLRACLTHSSKPRPDPDDKDQPKYEEGTEKMLKSILET